jgi:hypothetical protein
MRGGTRRTKMRDGHFPLIGGVAPEHQLNELCHRPKSWIPFHSVVGMVISGIDRVLAVKVIDGVRCGRYLGR